MASSEACDRRPPAAQKRALPVGGGARASLAAAGPARRPLSPALRVRACAQRPRERTCSSGSQRSRLAGSCRSRAPGSALPAATAAAAGVEARQAPHLAARVPPRPCLRVSPARVTCQCEAETEKRASVLPTAILYFILNLIFIQHFAPARWYLLSGILVLFFFFIFIFCPPLCFCFFVFFFLLFFSPLL